jgi:uncharacterized protein (TIGR03382 family)
VTNIGPSRATGVVVTVTRPVPTGPDIGATTEITGFTGCTRNADASGAALDSCTIGDIVDFAAPVEVTFTVALNVPPTIPATCPPATLLGGLSVSVNVDANTTCTTCPVTQTVPGSAYDVAPYADFETKITGPASASQGQAVTYAIQVTNLGPCPAPNSGFSADDLTNNGAGNLLTNQTIGGAGCGPGDDNWECTFGTIAPGEVRAFVYNYTMGQLPGSFYSTSVPFGGTAGSADIIDTGSANASASVATAVTNTPGGCNSAEGGGLLGVLGLLGFAIRRRFS